MVVSSASSVDTSGLSTMSTTDSTIQGIEWPLVVPYAHHGLINHSLRKSYIGGCAWARLSRVPAHGRPWSRRAVGEILLERVEGGGRGGRLLHRREARPAVPPGP